MLREFGEKPDKLKKAEIIDRIVELTKKKGSPLEKPAYWSKVRKTWAEAWWCLIVWRPRWNAYTR